MADKKCDCKAPLSKRIGSFVYNIIIVLLIVVAIVFVTDRANNRVTFVFGRAVVIIATGSMDPEIPAGSCVLIEKAEARDIRIGDVITFYSDDPAIAGSMNTHRVEEIIEDSSGFVFRTKGDNNTVADSYPARGEELVGRYVRVLPILTVIAGALMGPYGIYIIIAFFVLYAAIMLIPGMIKKKRLASAERKAEYERRLGEEIERLKNNGGADSSETEKTPGDDEKQ